MEIKKSPKADLENKKTLFLEIGLVIALALAGTAFAISSKPEPEPYTPPKQDVREQEFEMDRTIQQQEQQPEQQKAKTQVLADVLTIVDRREAIRTACMLAEKGDVVLVAGKGHETYQDVKGVKHHFDDKEVLREAFGN